MKKPNLGKINVKSLGKKLKTGWNKNNQTILAVMAGACAIGAVIEAARSTPKAMVIRDGRTAELEAATKELQEGTITQEEFRKKQFDINLMTAKEYACCYGTTACLLILSVGSTACNYKISIGKQAALLGAYKALEARSSEFMEKAKEVVGEKKIDAIKKGIVKDHIEKADIPESIKDPEYEKDENGNYVNKPYAYPCWEDGTGRAFPSNATQIKEGMVKAAEICKRNDKISINQINEILDPTGRYLPPCKLGEHGFIAQDLVDDYSRLPYSLIAVNKEGYNHAFTAIVWDTDPVDLNLGDY